jgi:hypothetical protein
MSDAAGVKRNSADRDIKLSRAASAATTIGDITPGYELYCLTMGQFDLSDALIHCLDQVGAADVVIATWTAAKADLDKAERLLTDNRIRSLRFVVDQSFPNRQPKYYEQLINAFGTGSVCICRSHAKYVLIGNDDYTLVIRTSANLNANKRMENIEISNDAKLYDFMLSVTADIFAENGTKYAPELPNIEAVAPNTGIKLGANTIRVGK